MPVDEDGNSADVIRDPTSIISRMNIGAPYEQYISSACRDVSKRICRLLGVELSGRIHRLLRLQKDKVTLKQLKAIPPETISVVCQYLLGFFKITSPKQYAFYQQVLATEEVYEVLLTAVNEIVRLYKPIENEILTIDMITAIEQHPDYRPTYGKVSYVGNSGKRCITHRNIRIGPVYMMLLDKTADDWSSVSSAKLQHFGVLSPTIRSEKFAAPFRNTPVKTIGPTEYRIYLGYMPPIAIAEMHDRSNNPLTQRNMYSNILKAEHPTDIQQSVDRQHIELGNSKPLQLVKHTMTCMGFTTTYESE